jgi:hypothetical protein
MTHIKKTGPHQSLQAKLVDEPTHDRVVSMLEALPAEETLFYGTECNVVDWEGTSDVTFQEIEDHFAFVGGSRMSTSTTSTAPVCHNRCGPFCQWTRWKQSLA